MLQRGILLNIAINNTPLIFEIAYHDDLLTKSTPRILAICFRIILERMGEDKWNKKVHDL